MVKVLIGILIILFSPIWQSTVHDNDENEVEIKTANMIDLSKEPILQKILTSELSTQPSESDNQKGFIIVRYGKFKNGILLKISKYPQEILDKNIGFLGYAIIDNKILLFEGDDSINFRFLRSHNPAKIKYYANGNQKRINESLINYYYILDDIYAKYSQGNGWIWSDGKPDE